MPIINTGQTYFKTELTGRTRHRRQWWTGALVLQVEVADKTRQGLYVDGQPPAQGAPRQEWRAYARRCKAEEAQSWTETACRWRDATPQDMAELEGAYRVSVDYPTGTMALGADGKCHWMPYPDQA